MYCAAEDKRLEELMEKLKQTMALSLVKEKFQMLKMIQDMKKISRVKSSDVTSSSGSMQYNDPWVWNILSKGNQKQQKFCSTDDGDIHSDDDESNVEVEDDNVDGSKPEDLLNVIGKIFEDIP